ncbi:MAG: WecB/TagA/CpsF family glycosyltransferase [Pseudomonadota bacterium]
MDGSLPVEAPYRAARRTTERIHILGGDIDLVRPQEVMHHIGRFIAAKTKAIIANHNSHSLYLLKRRPELASFFAKADLIEMDSTPVIFFARLLGMPARTFHRCSYVDFRPLFWSMVAASRYRVFYIGGAPGVVETASERLMARYPGALIGGRDGYFDATPGSEGNAEALAQISAFKPDILFVGMGMPRQELWIEANLEALPNCVIMPVGAAFDYEADVQVAPPPWMSDAGLVWAFRLAQEPRRMFARYLLEPWALLPLAFKDVAAALSRRRAPGEVIRQA